MARKRFSPEQIISMLREAEVRLSQGEKVKGDLPGLWDHGADLLPLAERIRWDEGFAGQTS